MTINNYIRNIKVFFNWLTSENEIRKNPVEIIEQIKTERRKKLELQKKNFDHYWINLISRNFMVIETKLLLCYFRIQECV